MALFRTLSMLLGALAVLWLGAASDVSAVPSDTPPCHEMVSGHGMTPDAPVPTPDEPMKAMSCCAALVAPQTPEPSIRAAVRPPAPAHLLGLHALLVGRTPAPEPGPPRTVAA